MTHLGRQEYRKIGRKVSTPCELYFNVLAWCMRVGDRQIMCYKWAKNMIHEHRTTYSNIHVTLPKMLTQPSSKVWLPSGITPLAMQQQGCPTAHVLQLLSLYFHIVVCDLLFYVSGHFPFC